MTHANAPLTPEGRRRLAVADRREGLDGAAGPPNGSRSHRRRRRSGRAGIAVVEPMTDRSSRPARSPRRCTRRLERRIVKLRYCRRWGPHRISYHLGVPRSTVGGCWPATGCRCWPTSTRPPGCRSASPSRSATKQMRPATGPRRHQEARPDPRRRRLARLRAWLCPGPRSRRRTRPRCTRGRMRLARLRRSCTTPSTTTPGWPTPRSSPTSARRPPQRSGPGPGLLRRRRDQRRAVMTDNGACYRSHDFAAALGTAEAPPDPALPATDQRQGRALQPHPGRRMGLRRAYLSDDGPRRDLRRLAALLQSPPTPHRHRRPRPRRPRSQRHGELSVGEGLPDLVAALVVAQAAGDVRRGVAARERPPRRAAAGAAHAEVVVVDLEAQRPGDLAVEQQVVARGLGGDVRRVEVRPEPLRDRSVGAPSGRRRSVRARGRWRAARRPGRRRRNRSELRTAGSSSPGGRRAPGPSAGRRRTPRASRSSATDVGHPAQVGGGDAQVQVPAVLGGDPRRTGRRGPRRWRAAPARRRGARRSGRARRRRRPGSWSGVASASSSVSRVEVVERDVRRRLREARQPGRRGSARAAPSSPPCRGRRTPATPRRPAGPAPSAPAATTSSTVSAANGLATE